MVKSKTITYYYCTQTTIIIILVEFLPGFLHMLLIFMTCRPILIKHLFSQMEAKVKGTLNYHGNLSDFPASEGDDTLGWLLEPT